VCGNILLFGKIEWTRLVSFYGNHNLTASTALMLSLCLNVLCYSLLIHKGTFLDSFYHFSFFSHSIEMLCEAPCLLAQPVNPKMLLLLWRTRSLFIGCEFKVIDRYKYIIMYSASSR